MATGAFSLVVEAVTEGLADRITGSVPMPTVGIGVSARGDGQVLLSGDAPGQSADFTPTFVRRHAPSALRSTHPRRRSPRHSPQPSGLL